MLPWQRESPAKTSYILAFSCSYLKNKLRDPHFLFLKSEGRDETSAKFLQILYCGEAVASWLECSTPDRAVRVRVGTRDIVLCSWARNFTLMVPLSTHVYKGYRQNAGGNPAMD